MRGLVADERTDRAEIYSGLGITIEEQWGEHRGGNADRVLPYDCCARPSSWPTSTIRFDQAARRFSPTGSASSGTRSA